MHSQTDEQNFQEIENSIPERLQEGNFSNLCEGEGETGEEPRSPPRITHPLNSLDKGSVVKIIIENIQSPQIGIPDRGSAIKTNPVKAIPAQPRNTLLDIPEGYWHIFDQMA